MHTLPPLYVYIYPLITVSIALDIRYLSIHYLHNTVYADVCRHALGLASVRRLWTLSWSSSWSCCTVVVSSKCNLFHYTNSLILPGNITWNIHQKVSKCTEFMDILDSCVIVLLSSIIACIILQENCGILSCSHFHPHPLVNSYVLHFY